MPLKPESTACEAAGKDDRGRVYVAAPLFLGCISHFDIEASYPAVRILDGPFRSRSEIPPFCDVIPIGSVKNLPSSEDE